MTITICGSMRFADEMLVWKKKLEKLGFEVLVPGGLNKSGKYKMSLDQVEDAKRKIDNDYIRGHYKSIQGSEGILVLNYDKDGICNYIGANSLMEMGFAFTLNRDIFLLNPIPDISSSAEIEAMQPIIINDDESKIADYYQNLPKVFLSSDSVIKVKATSLAFREYDMRFMVIGYKTTSGVNEQPYSIEEAHKGAENRLNNLKEITKTVKPEYYVSIESGDAIIHPKYNYYGLSVCMVQSAKGKLAVTIETDLEIPKTLTDLVPSKYPDLGVLVQKKFGIKNKDPYVYFTNGKLTRYKLVYNSVVNTNSLS